MKIWMCLSFLLSLCMGQADAQIRVLVQDSSIVDQHALTIKGKFGRGINGKSFQQDVLVSLLGYQYVAFYDVKRRVCVARRKLPNGAWDIIRFSDYDFRSNDGHNIISMGICENDGTIHLAFDHHVDTLHYKVSRKGLATHPQKMVWDESAFGSVQSELIEGKVIRITYPRFINTPTGGLQFCYRRGGSGNGDRMLIDYNSDKGKWENIRQIDSGAGVFIDGLGSSNSRCSYPNGYDYDANGLLHVTWVWREDSQGANHDLAYVFSDDQGKHWKNSAGEQLAEIPHVNSPGITVQSIPRELGLMNTHGQTIDSEGRIHTIMYHCTKETIKQAGSKPGEFRWGPQEAKRYHHYWRNVDGQWEHRELPWRVGNRPKVFADSLDNLIMIYRGDLSERHSVQNAEDKREDLIVAFASAKEKWKDWRIVYSLEGPFLNDMLGDRSRWQSEGVLTILLQDVPVEDHAPSRLRVIDLLFNCE